MAARRLGGQTFGGDVGAADGGAGVFAGEGEADEAFDHQGLVGRGGGAGAGVCLGEGVAVGGFVR